MHEIIPMGLIIEQFSLYLCCYEKSEPSVTVHKQRFSAQIQIYPSEKSENKNRYIITELSNLGLLHPIKCCNKCTIGKSLE